MNDSSSVAAPKVKKRGQKLNSAGKKWIVDYIKENFITRAQLKLWQEADVSPPNEQVVRVVKEFKKIQRFEKCRCSKKDVVNAFQSSRIEFLSLDDAKINNVAGNKRKRNPKTFKTADEKAATEKNKQRFAQRRKMKKEMNDKKEEIAREKEERVRILCESVDALVKKVIQYGVGDIFHSFNFILLYTVFSHRLIGTSL
jgi:chemotaxis protein histidine kinase CheA